MIKFTPVEDFYAPAFRSQYCAGMTYTITPQVATHDEKGDLRLIARADADRLPPQKVVELTLEETPLYRAVFATKDEGGWLATEKVRLIDEHGRPAKGEKQSIGAEDVGTISLVGGTGEVK